MGAEDLEEEEYEEGDHDMGFQGALGMSWKDAPPSPVTGSHLGRDDPKRCNQIKIMPFIQTGLAQSESASPKATTLYVYNMSLFRVVCLLNRYKEQALLLLLHSAFIAP
jgi:hypothetical protein